MKSILLQNLMVSLGLSALVLAHACVAGQIVSLTILESKKQSPDSNASKYVVLISELHKADDVHAYAHNAKLSLLFDKVITKKKTGFIFEVPAAHYLSLWQDIYTFNSKLLSIINNNSYRTLLGDLSHDYWSTYANTLTNSYTGDDRTLLLSLLELAYNYTYVCALDHAIEHVKQIPKPSCAATLTVNNFFNLVSTLIAHLLETVTACIATFTESTIKTELETIQATLVAAMGRTAHAYQELNKYHDLNLSLFDYIGQNAHDLAVNTILTDYLSAMIHTCNNDRMLLWLFDAGIVQHIVTHRDAITIEIAGAGHNSHLELLLQTIGYQLISSSGITVDMASTNNYSDNSSTIIKVKTIEEALAYLALSHDTDNIDSLLIQAYSSIKPLNYSACAQELDKLF